MLFSTCWRWLHGGQQQPWVHLHDVKHWALEALQVETVAACAVVAASTPLRFEQVHPELRLLWLARSCRGILEVVVPRWRHSSLRRADVTATDDRECVLSKLANLALDIATADALCAYRNAATALGQTVAADATQGSYFLQRRVPAMYRRDGSVLAPMKVGVVGTGIC